MPTIFIPYLEMDDGGYVPALWFGSGCKTKDEAFRVGRAMQKKFENYNVGIKVKKLGVFDMLVELKTPSISFEQHRKVGVRKK